MWNSACNWPRSRLSIVYMEQVSMLLDWRLVVKESESTMTRERLNRLWARPFDFSSSCIPSWARSRRRWKRRRWKEAVGRKEGYTKYGGKRDGATRIEKEEADEGRRETRREWDEKFSLASLRCLYTRGSCIAMGYISVLRERGAPPKNQIECKNRINSSCKLESYVCPVGSLPKLSLFRFLFSLSLRSFSFLHALYLKPVWSFSLSLLPFSSFSSQPGLQARSHDSTSRKGRSPPIFSFILLVCQHESYVVSRAYEESALYRQVKRSLPTFRGAKIILLGDTDYHLDQLCTREHLTLIK